LQKISSFAWLEALYQHGPVFTPSRIRYFSLVGFKSTCADSLPVTHGIKAVLVREAML
jgi:hypothetical protein